MQKPPRKNKKNDKYNADNEIIIGVTAKPKEKVRVDNKKATRTESAIKNKKNNQNKKKKVIKNNKKENKIKKNNRKKVLISICILFIIIICGTIYCVTTPIFNIQNIEVYGNENNTKDTYISLSKVYIGTTNIFAITKNNIEKSIKENPYVSSVRIERRLPDTIEIHVTERKVDYQIEYNQNYIYLDKQGYIVEVNDSKKNVPIIKGVSSVNEEFKVGQRLNNDDLLKLDTVLKIVNYCTYNSIENTITSIDISDTTNYILDFGKDKKKAYLGDASNLSERILWLKTILEKEKDNKGEIFINGDLNNDKVYFREN